MTMVQETYTYSYLTGFGQEEILEVKQMRFPRGAGSFYEYKDASGRVIRHERVTQDKEGNPIFNNRILVADLSDGFFIKTDQNNTVRECEAVMNSTLSGLVEGFDASGKSCAMMQMKNNQPHGKYARSSETDDIKLTTYYWEGEPKSRFMWSALQNYEDVSNGKAKPVIERVTNLFKRFVV